MRTVPCPGREPRRHNIGVGCANNRGAHHRGQLSAYLRPMGAKVPAIYGESYDSAQAKKAQA